MDLPDVFCWTRFGTEAGQSFDDILRRKEVERVSNGGVFLWGIGNSIGPSVAELLRVSKRPQVLFSPTRSTSRPVDAAPGAIAAWTRASAIDGSGFDLPAHSLVTSHFDGVKASHFALVCSSQVPLLNAEPMENIGLTLDSVKNLKSGTRIGASQVTSVVRWHKTARQNTGYPVALVADLVFPYFIRLSDPVRIQRDSADASWTDAVSSFRATPRSSSCASSRPLR